MIKTTIWRQVVIAALLAGGSFTVAAKIGGALKEEEAAK